MATSLDGFYNLADKQQLGHVMQFIGTLPGALYEITIKPVSKRSNKQRRYFHLCLTVLADYTGYTKEQMKSAVKANILGTEVVQMPGYCMEMAKSSEQCTKEEYSLLIEECLRLGAELECKMPEQD